MTQQTAENIYQHTLLADAAYLDWDKPVSELNLINKRKFTQKQAEKFLDRYKPVGRNSDSVLRRM